MTKFLKLILVSCAIVAMAASCTPSSSDVTASQTVTGCFTYSQDVTTGTAKGVNGVGYVIDLNYTKGTANIKISNLTLADGVSYPTITLQDMPFTLSEKGWLTISGRNVAATPAAAAPLFNSVEFKMVERAVSNNYYFNMYGTMEIDSRYQVLTAQNLQFEFGTTRSNSNAGDQQISFETTDTDYALSFNVEKMTVSILMRQTRFVQNMPAMDIVIPDVPFQVGSTILVFEAPSVVPTIGNTPYPGYTIENLYGTLWLDKGMDMRFNCKPESMGGMEFNVNVNATLEFTK